MKSNATPKNSPEKLIKSLNLFPVVGIGASAGGLDAFKKLIKAIPVDSGMAYVLVQHLDPNHESLLPEILQKVTSIPVLAITDDIKVQPNHIYIIPSNKMMVATDGVLLLTARPAKSKNERNLPIDLFFTSLAEVHQSHSIGVVLSGTASDGTLGLKAIKEHGGITFAQDEASAAYEGMPASAVQAGVVDFILPPEKIPEKLLEVTKIITAPASAEQHLPLEDEEVFRQINSVLRIRKGTDFTYYKQTTIRRRILRRMAINKNEEPAAYLKYLRENKAEQDVLYQDLLISVTAFFRDNKSFVNLFEKVFPSIIKNKPAGEIIRVWVAGCSTGEEAYSIAICFKEFLGGQSPLGNGERVQIFATDLSEPAITKARTGVYTNIELAGVSPQRLHEFFTKTNGSYQVSRQIRDVCVFANHNFLKDPPFGKIDLISCRNVLIYMEPYLQKKALTTFHYALNPKGFLLLGKSETTGGVPELFAPAAKNDKLYTRKDVQSTFTQAVTQQTEFKISHSHSDARPKNDTMRSDFQKTADDIMLSKYTPVGVVVNEAMDIVQFRGSTSSYLEQSSGKPSHNLIAMAKPGLAFELRNIIHKVKKEKVQVTKENIPVQVNGSMRSIAIEAIPLPNTVEPYYLILFHDSNSPGNKQMPVENKKAKGKIKEDDKDLRIRQLEQELVQTREDMRSITEDQEAANEELQSANEELLSGSEELQSLNEELETSKEELQSTNEELTVVNQEMVGLNEQIAVAKNYAESIVENIREPLLVMDKNLRIKTANKAFYKTFRVNERETEGVLIYDLGNKQWNIPELRTLLEKILPEKSIFNDFEVTHTFPHIGELVLLLNAREVINKNNAEKLILLSIENITEKADARKKLEESEKRFRLLTNTMPQKITNADAEGNVVFFNQQWIDDTGFTLEELKGWGWEKAIHPDDFAKTAADWKQSVITGHVFEMEFRIRNKKGQYRWHLSRAVPVKDENGKLTMWVGSTTDIHEQKEQKTLLEEAVKERTKELENAYTEVLFQNEEKEKREVELTHINKELEAFAYVSSHDLQEPLRKIQMLAGLVLEREYQNLSDNGKNHVQFMQDSANRMQTLIQDLLAFSSLTSAERTFETVDLKVIIDEIKVQLKETIDEKHAIIEATELGPVKVIVFQFRQLMQNIIGNALKFSRPKHPPHIIIKSNIITGSTLENKKLVPEKNYCQITISDNGIGFEKEYNEKIFEVFQKLHGKEEYPGTGIGLAIVKKIVDNHNGTITAQGRLKKGTTFDIFIPA